MNATLQQLATNSNGAALGGRGSCRATPAPSNGNNGHHGSPLDAANSSLITLYGDPLAREVGFYSLADRLFNGERVVVIDAANEFNAYVFSDIAQRAGVPPQQLLSRLLISRAFTCHQLATLIVERTRPTLERYRARTLVALDLLTTFYDEEVPRWEAERVLRRPLQCLRWLANHGYQVLLLCPHESKDPVRPGPHHNSRRAFFEQLKVLSDRVLRVSDEYSGEKNDQERRIVRASGTPRSAITVICEKPWTGESWQLEFDPAFTRRRKHQPPMRWLAK